MSFKRCSICNKSSEAEGISLIYFGEWLTKKELTVHYYCLLLSTHLPQNGLDHSGILGFLLRDIRHEIAMAKKRKCKYCFDTSASIRCDKCRKYFHLTCGHTSKCISQFVGEFKSYCHVCIPMDSFQKNLLARRPPQSNDCCYICARVMSQEPKYWIYAKCCGSGFTHAKCMKIYALSAGYYLTCIWCKDKSFREDVKYQGVFVPDRDANWEREKDAFRELYRQHKRCDMEVCNCPRGRDYANASKWELIFCKFCGAFGAHNPFCIPGFENSKEKIKEFKCDICSVTEQTVFHKPMAISVQDVIDTSLFINKDSTKLLQPDESTTTTTSYDSIASQKTINTKLLQHNFSNIASGSQAETDNKVRPFHIASAVYTLTQSQEQNQVKSMEAEAAEDENYDSDDSTIADLLVDKLLCLFDVKCN